ncbi:MAG: mechanosensitive ion channel family protein [Frankiaceae bacterium]|nr:mechanosensitive ion channel family protein [Frankiaceae bacterium]
MTSTPEPSPSSIVERLPDGAAEGAGFAVDWVAASLRIALVLVVAFLLRALVHRAVDKVVTRAIARPVGHESVRQRLLDMSPSVANERRRQRAETIGSVLRSSASILIMGVAFTTVLSEVGVDLGPVLASAGILGVALGFGAQNLVKDFLNGIAMILEDQYGVGDAVDLGEASGIIEAVGLRVTRLRSVDGTVWYVRNGEVLRVGNMSQGWSRALLDISVAYGTNVDHAEDVIERVAREVWEGDKVGEFVLAEPEIWGVERLGADGMDIRLVVKTAPLEQWKVARELRHRLKEAFDAEGIEIPLPQRSLWLRTSPEADPTPVTDPPPAPAPSSRRDAPAPPGEVEAMRDDSGALERPVQ